MLESMLTQMYRLAYRPIYDINVKKLQFIQVLTATCIEWHIENSKYDKKVILAIITSPKRQCDAE